MLKFPNMITFLFLLLSALSSIMAAEFTLLRGNPMTVLPDVLYNCAEEGYILDINTCRTPLYNVYFHSIFDFQRPSSISLFVHQICRTLTLCIPPENFRIVIHSATDAFANDYSRAFSFLDSVRVPFFVWTGIFDTVISRKIRLLCLRNVDRAEQLILQLDADEFPVFDSTIFRQMVTKIQTQSCDIFFGKLYDRLTETGTMVNISLNNDPVDLAGNTKYLLNTESFPFSCEIKASIEKAQIRKLILYRANYRPAIGNHNVMCGYSSGRKHCLQQFVNKLGSQMSEFVSDNVLTAPDPHICHYGQVMKQAVADVAPLPSHITAKDTEKIFVDHYKYTWGVDAYLNTRVKNFKAAKITWHEESTSVLNHMTNNGGDICVTCKASKCRNLQY